MSADLSRIRAPLHVHVATLFIVLVLIVGGTMAALQYHSTSQIIEGTSQQTVDLMVRYIESDLYHRQKSTASILNLMAQSDVIGTNSWLMREQYIPWLQQLVRDADQVTDFVIGFPDGDVLMVYPLRSARDYKHFGAPESAEFVLDHIDREGDKLLEARRYVFAGDLTVIKEVRLVDDIFDPRIRPWYQQAMRTQNMIYTPPYPFLSTGEIGITLARSHAGVVVAADFTLNSLSTLLASFPLPEASLVALFDAQGQALGFPDLEKMRPRQTGFAMRTPMLDELGSNVLKHYAVPLLTLSGEHRLEFGDQVWRSDVRDVTFVASLPMKLAVLIPEKSLLTDALLLRDRSVGFTFLIILLSLPLAWLLSRLISRPLRKLARDSANISCFNFSEVAPDRSLVLEIDELGRAIKLMNDTIAHFLQLIESLAQEKQLDALLSKVAAETCAISEADAALLLLFSEDRSALQPRSACLSGNGVTLDLDQQRSAAVDEPWLRSLLSKQAIEQHDWLPDNELCQMMQFFCPVQVMESSQLVLVPLISREGNNIGVLCLHFQSAESLHGELYSRFPFIRTLSGFSAVSLETRQYILHQKKLFAAFVELIAGAIDAKSPYTGGHCQRVPELTKMLARAACESNQPPFRDFQLSEEQWEELHIAGWLHDCGKITTPEHVVDKATKLEARYDRIHEVRMRFELLKCAAQRDYWRSLAEAGAKEGALEELQNTLHTLDREFAFVASCNLGAENLPEEDKHRLLAIAKRTWTRTLSDRLGISWEEHQRKEQHQEYALPVQEFLLADKDEHRIRHDDLTDHRRRCRFNLTAPAFKYDLGELHNLTVPRGTLSNEERFLINDHIVQTILMLERLPYPDYLKAIPQIAGGHHERMDGKGYPYGLLPEQMPVTARMMAIADIFEALTAADRPYKTAKPLSECLSILSRMVRNNHVDPEIFRLFIESGVYMEYARRFLKPEQLDTVDERLILESVYTEEMLYA